MSDIYDHAYDDQGNVVRIRYAPLPEQSFRHSSIRPVSSAELRQRRDEEEAEREQQKARARAEEKKIKDEECAAHFRMRSLISPQKRAMQLDDLSEDKGNANKADHD